VAIVAQQCECIYATECILKIVKMVNLILHIYIYIYPITVQKREKELLMITLVLQKYFQVLTIEQTLTHT
jgi:hypothetical protein